MAKRLHPERTSDDPWRQWHRLFGLLLTDNLADSPFTVELERDLSIRRQLLDVIIVRRRPGKLTRPQPDGLDDLVAHNLITFKSFREPLNDWALKELTGHYVNYRKEVSPRGKLLPEEQFRLYAVCARHPRDLFSEIAVESLQPGVYNCRRGSDTIRIIVAGELPKVKRNALLHLFSAAPDQLEYGQKYYRVQLPDTSSIINQLFEEYRREGLTMPYTMKDFRRDNARQHLHELTPEERLAGLPAEEVLEHYTEAQIEAYLKRLREASSTAKKKKRRR